MYDFFLFNLVPDIIKDKSNDLLTMSTIVYTNQIDWRRLIAGHQFYKTGNEITKNTIIDSQSPLPIIFQKRGW